ncbi:MAG TPA: hypothetical protein VFV48_00525 [Pseudomonadales bacterium]|nr:hypothetical protein [Pseudomonadales bacterium]
MSFQRLSELIAQAKRQEQEGHLLTRQLEKITSGLHSSIHFSAEKKSISSLSAFVVKYIEHTPRHLRIMVQASLEAQMQRWISPIIKLTEDFFLRPPACMGQEKSLLRLMESAYLAHRLIEEINDRYLLETGQILIPIDMTTANLIIHQLIGEPFANQLDALCVTLASDLINSQLATLKASASDVSAEQQKNWILAWQHWSEVLDEKNVSISL